MLRRVPASVRVGAFITLLAGAAIVLYVAFLRGQVPDLAPVDVPWYVMAAAFFGAELKVVDVHFRREKHSFSLSEFPAVIGFFLLSPGDYFLAMLAGTGLALVVHGQSPKKLAFNLANFAFTAAVAMSVFYALESGHGVPQPADWIAAFAATSIAAALSAVSIATAISMSGGAPQFEKLPEMIQFGALVAIANTSLALLAVSVLWLDPELLALLIVPLLTVFLAYRAYISEREKHERLELLYQSSRILQHSPELDSALAALLEHAREMFRAERAEVLLWPRDAEVEEGLLTVCHQDRPPRLMVPVPLADADRLHRRVAHERRAFLHISPDRHDPAIRNAMTAPLLGEAGLIGSMVVANRLTEGTTFSDDDLRLLETLANQAAVALENGQLEQSLAELSRLKEQLRFQAYHDPLTGLANRSLFAEQVNGALEVPAEARVPVVLFLDLDNFKDVNDALGHPAGDRLLTAVAERVQSCVRGGDVAARLGGDEFAILLLDDPDLGAAVTVATRLIAAFAITFPVMGQDLKCSASIGIAAALGPTDHADDLLRNADVAMYTAKQAGKNRFAVFEPTMHAAIVARHAMSTELSHAVDDGEIDVYYQPVLSLATGMTYGVEALARWRHPTRGFVEPDEFIPLAEESGAILALGRAVLFEACREAAPWRGDNGEGISLTVNLAAAQLAQETFIDDLVDILRSTGFPASRLVLEMTETVMFTDTQTTIARLTALRDLGVRIAVDDFGTGYSSLGYLRRFKVDILKIAREFIATSGSGPDGWAFASAIVALGRSLGLRIIAEGIEDADQLEQLREMGCEFGQGYLFAKAMPGEAMAEHLQPPATRRAAGRAAASPAFAIQHA
ncbi:MAG TPA: EAL domain-containing protein [Candidatus Limnocylindrales bacterium]|jgi:diguanylate cyclase (GGDEF)-like protein